jgi:hypothetical protein
MVAVRIKRKNAPKEIKSNKDGKCQNHNFVVRDVILEVLAATEFNEMFSGWVCRRLKPSHQRHPEDRDGFISRNVGKPSHPDVAVCPRKLN